MRGMILAAGRGSRMGSLTDTVPKCLLKVGRYHLIEYAIASLKRAGIDEIVVNMSYHAEQIKALLQEGRPYDVAIAYSEEPVPPLDVGGGLRRALPLLGDQPFVVMSADIITAFSLATLPREPRGLAHLVFVDNPAFHPQGDFGLEGKYVSLTDQPTFTFASLGIYRPEAIASYAPDVFSWSHFMLPLITKREITGEYYQGLWYNVGTPQDLAEVNAQALCHPTQFLAWDPEPWLLVKNDGQRKA